MKKKSKAGISGWFDVPENLLRKMKVTVFLCLFTVFQVAASGLIAQKKVSLDMHNASLQEVFSELRRQTGDVVVFSTTEVNQNQQVNAVYQNRLLTEVLDDLLVHVNLSYKIVEDYIVIFKKEMRPVAAAGKRVITGKVTDDKGESIPGANIVVKGTTRGAVSDIDGNYTLEILETDQYIVVSFVGYQSQEIHIAGRKIVNVVLESESMLVDEVVVLAYGSQKKKDVIASVASMRGNELVKAPVAGFDQAMQGKMSGVMISSASGTPGGAISVNIRGASSISAGNDPLYVVDGVPIVPTDNSQQQMGGQKLSPISDINPNDIAGIQVLKDAAAAALYGSRASNGVILITTKRGSNQRTKITLDSYVGFSNLWRKLDFLNAGEWVAAKNEAIDNFNRSLGYTEEQSGFKSHIRPDADGVNTDWFDEITRSAAIQTSHQLSVAGGNEKTQFFMSGGYFYQEGIVERNQYDRINLRTNVDHRINKRVKLSGNIALSYSDNDRILGDNHIYAPWLQAMRARPDQSVYSEDGSYYPTTVNNPVQLMKEPIFNNKTYRAIVNLQSEVKILEGLVWRANIGGDYSYMNEYSFFPKTSKQGVSSNGAGEDYRTFAMSNVIENTLTYTQVFGKHTFSALLGHSFQKTKINQSSITGSDFPSDQLEYLGAASSINSGKVKERANALESYFGRLNYSYDERYLLEFSLRRDASSKFSKDNRVGYFPSGSVGWRISNESFFPENKILTDVKVRGSLGLTGNQEGIPFFDFYSVYESGANYNGKPGLALPSRANNPDLTWEKTLQTDIGLDAEFLGGRIELTFDWFKQDTKDLLLTHNINGVSGYAEKTSNVGSVVNKGYEIQVFSRNLVNRLKWNTSFNISFIKNEITAMNKNAQGQYEGMNVGTANRLEVGQGLGDFYLVKMLGIYQSEAEIPQALWDKGIRPGDVKYEDRNKDGLYNEDDKQFAGSPFPKFYGGLDNNFSFCNFDLALGLQFSYGNKLYAYWKEKSSAGNLGGSDYAIFKEDWDNRWRPDAPNNDTPRAVAAGSAFSHNSMARTTRFLEDASYLRIKSLTFGYTLPEAWTKKVLVQSCRFYFTANNLYTFTKYDGFDPEVDSSPGNAASRGVDFATVPQMRSFIFGLNMTF